MVDLIKIQEYYKIKIERLLICLKFCILKMVLNNYEDNEN